LFANKKLQSAYGCFATIWGTKLVSTYKNYLTDDLQDQAAAAAEVIKTLYKITMEKTWYDEADET